MTCFAGGSELTMTKDTELPVAAAMIYPSTLALLTSTFTGRKQKAIAVGIWSGVLVPARHLVLDVVVRAVTEGVSLMQQASGTNPEHAG